MILALGGTRYAACSSGDRRGALALGAIAPGKRLRADPCRRWRVVSRSIQIAAVLGAVALAPAASVQAAPMQGVVEYHLLNTPANWTPAYTARVEHAIEHVAGTQLAPAWHAAKVAFGDTGVQIRFAGPRGVKTFCRVEDAGACHTDPPGRRPVIWISTGTGTFEAAALSHEVFEYDVDPLPDVDPTVYKGSHTVIVEEVCDPMRGATQNVYGVPVSVFVYPRYYQNVAAVAPREFAT